jgi:hypothetical protein
MSGHRRQLDVVTLPNKFTMSGRSMVCLPLRDKVIA